MSSPPNTHAPPHKPAGHKPHRPHVVGGQRAHGRNTSQMNLNKLQRLAMAHNAISDLHGGQETPVTGRRHHARKKSAPSSPATSPKTGHHVRWNGSAVALGGVSSNNPAMRKNLSTPILKREGSSGNIIKKGHLLGELSRIEKTEEKKSVGFELAGSDDDDDEWEDHSSPSGASTRRNSLVMGKAGNTDGNPQGTALTFTKSPLVQQNNAADMKPELSEGPAAGEAQPDSTKSTGDTAQPTEQGQNDVPQRLLSRQHSGMVPPAVSSVSATATQAPPERSSRVSSFANLSSLGGINQPDTRHNNEREDSQRFSPNATPSSTDVGVSRFLITHPNGGSHPGGRSESDFSTPSSFLPNYQPRTPPSPETAITKALKSPSRRRPAEPHSRTQQKLWLQRTATLSTSPSETSMGSMTPAVVPQVIDSNAAHARLALDPHRAATAAGGFAGGPSTEGESKRIKKVYERLSTEFSVMHRFRNPVVDSLNRMYDMTKPPAGQGGTSQPSASSNPGNLNTDDINHESSLHARNGSHSSNTNTSKQVKQGSVRFKDHEEAYNDDSDDLNDQSNDISSRSGYHLTEEELLVRRMWNSLEVAAPGD